MESFGATMAYSNIRRLIVLFNDKCLKKCTTNPTYILNIIRYKQLCCPKNSILNKIYRVNQKTIQLKLFKKHLAI